MGSLLKKKKEQARLFEKKANILLGTEAAGEGLNLQFANIAINYELPWNPNRLEQRIGRVYRYGQKKKVFIYNFKTAFPIDEAVLHKILEKMENIRAIYGSNTIDVIGSMISEKEILEIFRIAQGRGSAVDKVDQLFTEKLEVFKDIELFFIKESFNLVNVISLTPNIDRCINNFDIERFFLTWAENNHSIEIQPTNNENYQYNIRLPRTSTSISSFCTDRKAQNYDEMVVTGVFDPDKKGTYLALGHPIINCAVDDSLTKHACSIVNSPEKGVILTYVLKFYDGLDREIYAEPILLSQTEKEIISLDPLMVWDYTGYDTDQILTIDSDYYLKVINELSIDPVSELKQYIEKTEEFVKEKHEKDLDREFNFTFAEYNWKIKNQKQKQEKYQQTGQNYLIGAVENTISRLKHELRSLREKNQNSRNIRWTLCGPIDVALMVPPSTQKNWNPIDEQARINLEKLKREIELKGMKVVCRYEREHERIPEDVSKETVRGYDILSKGKEEKRYIEVKSFSTTNPIQISSNEWRVASQLREDYFLYVVENLSKEPNSQLSIIPDPYQNLEKCIRKVPIEDYKMVLDAVPDEYDTKNPD